MIKHNGESGHFKDGSMESKQRQIDAIVTLSKETQAIPL